MATVKANTVLLKAQAKRLECNLDIKDRKYHTKTYASCFVGTEAVKLIIELGFAKCQSSAVEFGNKLIQANIIQHVKREHNFKNKNLFYEFIMDLSTADDLVDENITFTQNAGRALSEPDGRIREHSASRSAQSAQSAQSETVMHILPILYDTHIWFTFNTNLCL